MISNWNVKDIYFVLWVPEDKRLLFVYLQLLTNRMIIVTDFIYSEYLALWDVPCERERSDESREGACRPDPFSRLWRWALFLSRPLCPVPSRPLIRSLSHILFLPLSFSLTLSNPCNNSPPPPVWCCDVSLAFSEPDLLSIKDCWRLMLIPRLPYL